MSERQDLAVMLDRRIATALAADYTALQREFQKKSIGIIRGFLDVTALKAMRDICYRCLSDDGYLRDLKLKTIDNTPRRYRSSGYNAVRKHAPIIEYLHKHDGFRQIISKISGLTPDIPEFEAEWFIINQQCG
jgi:uncharacterized LabA/DUF88 family protein